MEKELPQDTSETQMPQVKAKNTLRSDLIFVALILVYIYSAYKTKGSIITKIIKPLIYGTILVYIILLIISLL